MTVVLMENVLKNAIGCKKLKLVFLYHVRKLLKKTSTALCNIVTLQYLPLRRPTLLLVMELQGRGYQMYLGTMSLSVLTINALTRQSLSTSMRRRISTC